LLAVPKKGRLHEKCVELLTGESHSLVDSGTSESRLMSRGGYQIQPSSPSGCRSRSEPPISSVGHFPGHLRES